MPTVRSYGQPAVATAPLPNARVITDAPANTFGGPVDIAPAVGVIAEMQARERRYADQVATNKNELAAAALRNRVLDDPQTGALTLKGTKALGALDQARASWTKGISEIESGITDDRQKELFQLRAQAHWQDVETAVQRHAHSEFVAEDTRTTNAMLSMVDDEAIQNASNPDRLAFAIAKKKATLADYGARQGWSPETLQEKTTQAVSATHMNVVEHLLNNDQDIAASTYLAAHRDEFAVKDLLQAERLTDAGSVRAESQRVADEITAKAPTLSKALEQVRATQDPRVRDALETRVRRFYADQKSDLMQERADAFQQASAIVEKTGDFGKVPLSVRVKMSPEENGALQRREEQIRNPKRTTNPDIYSSLLNAAGLNDATRDWFRDVNLATYRNQLSEEDFNRVSTLQLSARLEESRGVAGEAKRQANIAESTARKAAAAAAKHAEAIATLEKMGVHLGPKVPGAPIAKPIPNTGAPGNVDLRKPDVPAPTTPGVRTQRVPQSWLDHAARDSNYSTYLKHMGVQIP